MDRRAPTIADHALADGGIRFPRLLTNHGSNHNVVQSVDRLKVNPIGGLVLSVGFQFPVNRQGLRADVIYTGQVEYNF